MRSATTPRPGALVDPVAALTEQQAARAARQIVLPGFGDEAQRRLAAARVLVIGAGGLGSACVPYLVGAGVGVIGVVDDDRVELSNLHRQIAHGTADIGRPKVDSLAETAARLDPGPRIVTHDCTLTSDNALTIFADYDLVIDGSDNFPTRYLSNDAAQLTDTPLVWGAILQFHGQVSVAWHRYGPGYRDLFPQPPAPEDVLSCGTGGVLPGLCGTIGSLLATEAMKLITGVGAPLIGRALLYDALAATTRELPYTRDPEAPTVTELTDYERFCNGPGGGPQGITSADLTRMVREDATFALLDVRNPDERARLRISGSAFLPLPDLEADPALTIERPDEFPADAPIVVYCGVQPRAMRAVTLLQERGVENLVYLQGGITEIAQVAPELLEAGTDD
ncbi:adenylyltransferase/sulfurtransferase MoeZ [Leucobacter tardus]|uniref:ThiF family adenylyltransferase n=1 Tax=Leucobacter tardus TaxID=501483 RepID=A0A939QFB9_9MICO|nr:ThiF family adenylyltransferase [Leucobacter tardus]MBO2990886.1 ThiF family adenylyltransferase [Leucobacter tardus]